MRTRTKLIIVLVVVLLTAIWLVTVVYAGEAEPVQGPGGTLPTQRE